MNNSDVSILKDAIRLVESKVCRDYFELENLQTNHNATALFAKKTLIFLQQKFVAFFNEKRSNYNIYINGLEKNIDPNKKNTIYIDPIIGMMNFIHSIPYFCTAISIQEHQENDKNKVLCGVVNNYITQELFYVENGRGAFVDSRINNIRLRTSKRNNLSTALIGAKYSKDKTSIKNLISKLDNVKINGCSILDMLYVASGKLDACFVYEKNKINSELGALFVREAGGLILERQNNLLATNSILFPHLKELL